MHCLYVSREASSYRSLAVESIQRGREQCANELVPSPPVYLSVRPECAARGIGHVQRACQPVTCRNSRSYVQRASRTISAPLFFLSQCAVTGLPSRLKAARQAGQYSYRMLYYSPCRCFLVLIACVEDRSGGPGMPCNALPGTTC